MATSKFKPCEDCPTPAACKKAGKCLNKEKGKGKGMGVTIVLMAGAPVKKKAKKK